MYRVNVSLTGSIHFHFIKDRRLATLEFDEDGDVMLTPSDRSRDEEAEAYEVALAQPESVMIRVLDFLRK